MTGVRGLVGGTLATAVVLHVAAVVALLVSIAVGVELRVLIALGGAVGVTAVWAVATRSELSELDAQIKASQPIP